MTLKDPELLSQLLDNLTEKLQEWRFLLEGVLQDAKHIQRSAMDLSYQSEHALGICRSRFEEDREGIELAHQDARKQRAAVQAGIDSLDFLKQQLAELRLEAQQTLWHWEHELKLALEWLSRAQERLRKALAILEEVLKLVARAESRLRGAISDLNRCQSSHVTDAKGNRIRPDCSAYVREVRDAEYSLDQARDLLEEAREEVREAELEVAAAEKRVRDCEEAIGYAEKALEVTETAEAAGSQAQNDLERTDEEVASAELTVEQSQQLSMKQLDTLEQAELIQSDATAKSLESVLILTKADKNLASAEALATGAIQTLEERNAYLKQFANAYMEINPRSVGGSKGANISPSDKKALDLIEKSGNFNLEFQEIEANAEWKRNGPARTLFAGAYGRELHKDEQKKIANALGGKGYRQAHNNDPAKGDFGIELEIRHPSGKVCQLDFVDLINDKIYDWKRQHSDQDNLELTKEYGAQMKKYSEAYEALTGRTADIYIIPYLSTKGLDER